MIDTQFLIQKLKTLDPEKIILFGSYAKGSQTPESDIDIAIVKQTTKKPTARIAEVQELLWGHVPHIEPHVFTPEEFNTAVAENRFFVTQEILKYGKVIYEKSN